MDEILSKTYNPFQNLCEIVVWRADVFFAILVYSQTAYAGVR